MALREQQQRPTHVFRFNPQKALEVLVYLAEKLPNPTKAHISKVLYYADQDHLQHYCRFICGDRYYAMPDGSVPSGIFDIIKDVSGEHKSKFYPGIDSDAAFAVQNKYIVKPKRPADLDYLSLSDIECLDSAIKEHGHKSFSQLSRLSHEEPAYKEAAPNSEMSVITMARQFENSNDLISLIAGD